MRIPDSIQPNNRGAAALMMVLALSLVTLLILGSTLNWTTTNATLSQRNNEYYRNVAVAEAATEAVITRIDTDYKRGGDALVVSNFTSYKSVVPTSSANPIFGYYVFSDGQGNSGKTYVQSVPPNEFRNLSGQYRGLYGYSSTYRVISNARDTRGRFNITGAVRQDVDVTTIPLFQFAIFYNLDMEIHPGATMTVTGPVHGNQNIYAATAADLTFQSDVTAAGELIPSKKAGNPNDYSPPGPVTYQATHDSGVSTLDMPVGTNNTAAGVRQIVEVPPAGEALNSAMGKERFYNKADMIIKVTSTGSLSVFSGPNTKTPNTTVPSAQVNIFASTVSFYDKREAKTINAVQIDVGKLTAWNATNTVMRNALTQKDVSVIYAYDTRAETSTTEPGVRLMNGETLPPLGLTVATPDPVYIWGDYNVASSGKGKHDTSLTKPAAVIGDAVTILSANWTDSDATGALSARAAKNTTINTAIMAGIVQTGGGYYSGGVENFPRFLEDWNNDTLTYNGSMVVMYESKFADAPWLGTGTTIGIYNPPNRDWAFDMNFRNPAKLPPGTPSVRALLRSTWTMIKPNTTTVAN